MVLFSFRGTVDIRVRYEENSSAFRLEAEKERRGRERRGRERKKRGERKGERDKEREGIAGRGREDFKFRSNLKGSDEKKGKHYSFCSLSPSFQYGQHKTRKGKTC